MPAAEPAPPAAARGAKRAAAGGGGSSSAEKRSRTNKRRPLAVQAERQRATEGRRTRQTAALEDVGRKSDKGTSEEEEAESESRGRRTRGRDAAARSSRQRVAPSSESRSRPEEEDAGRRRSLRSRAASPAAAPSPRGSDSDTSLSSLQSVGAVEDLSPGRAAGRSPRGATRQSQEGATRRSQEGASGWRQLRSRASEETPPATAGAGSVDSAARTQRARPQPTARTTPAVTPGSRPSPGGRATRSRPAVPAPPDESPVRATRSRRGAGEEPPHEEEEEKEKVGGRGAPTRRALRSAGAAATPRSEVIADDDDGDVSRSKASKRTLVEVRPPRGRRLPPGRAVAEKSDSSAEDFADDSRRPATRRRSVAPPIAWEVVATTETGRGRTRSNSDESRRVSGIRLRAVVACDRLASDENKVKKEEEEKEEEEEEEEEEIFSKRLRNRRASRSAPKRRSLQEAGGGREEHGGGGGGEEEEDAGSHTKAPHRGSDDSESVIFGKKLRTKGVTSSRVGPSPKSRSLRGKPSCIKDDSAAEGAEGETKPEYGAAKSESEDSESAIFGKKLRKKTSSSRLRPSPKARSLRGKPRYGEEDSAEEEEEEEAKAEEREDDRTASKAAKSDGDSESDSAFYAKLRQQAATTRSRRAPRRAAAAPVAERDSGVAHRSDTDDSDSETFGMHARRKPPRSKRTARPRRCGKAPHAEEDSEGEERERKPARKTRRRPGGAEPDSGSDTAGVAARSASPVSDGGVVAPVSRGAESGDDSESEIFGKLRRKAVATGGGQRSASARGSRSLSAPPRDDSDSELFGERRTEPPPPDASFDSIVSQVAPAAAAPAASRQARPATTRCNKAHRNLWPSSRRGEAADKRTSDVGDSAESPAREPPPTATLCDVSFSESEGDDVGGDGGAPALQREQAWSPPAVPSSDSDTDVDDDDGDHQGAPADEDRGVAKSLAMARRQFYDLASAVVRPATFLPPGGADSSRDGDTESYSENDAEFGDGGGEGEGEGADTAAAGRDVGCQWEGGAEGATWPSFADLRREGESLMRRSKRATTAISTKSSQSAANFYPRI
ncbi:PREDICTED: splicing factor, arginine/serine-rich 19-like [Priapulus caudatus]|uniref:Splicing factor, arginine/serine-rich 19-like n=1 Tax=Priapulus caudatus TaxID=37621 RepID=A0ABM1EPP7_PRICU|nr:PREDICTED: splicing factor, arginine/serine-rich 19-like [Priapulus caudatus]